MKTPSLRKFTLLDAMILIAATALALAWIRGAAIDFRIYYREKLLYEWLIQGAIQAALPFQITWTIAILVIRLRQPRPRFRRLACQPGMIACSAATLALVVPALLRTFLAVGFRSAMNRRMIPHVNLADPHNILFEVAPVVPAAWLVMVLGGWWHPEASWIDRIGRFLGFAWVIEVLVEPYGLILFL